MKKIILPILLICSLTFASADKAISLYNNGKFSEASSMAGALDESSAKNLFAKGLVEKTGNEAAAFYRKALASTDVTPELSSTIYKRLAEYYGVIGMPGSVSVMLERADGLSKTSTAPIKILKDTVSKTVENRDTAKVEVKKSDQKVEEKSDQDNIDFASVEETEKKTVEKKPVQKTIIPKSVVKTSDSKVFYTLQTGAFGLESNATKMKIRLKQSFKTVTIKEQKSGERVLYKVRVGRFTNEQEALRYAAAKLRPKKIKFRIVKE